MRVSKSEDGHAVTVKRHIAGMILSVRISVN